MSDRHRCSSEPWQAHKTTLSVMGNMLGLKCAACTVFMAPLGRSVKEEETPFRVVTEHSDGVRKKNGVTA